jgi:DNA-binding XRE family transcriptional regulator
MEQDFLDEMIEESTRRNPEFPSLMEEAHQRRALLNKLAAVRISARISQQAVAKQIKTSQPAIARLEAGDVDPRLSTLQRYAASLGKRVEWILVDV